MCSVPVMRVESTENNITEIKEMLQNGMWMIADNYVNESLLTFTYNLSKGAWFNYNFVILDEITNRTIVGFPIDSLFQIYLKTAIWRGLNNFWRKHDCVFWIRGFVVYDPYVNNTHIMLYSTRDWPGYTVNREPTGKTEVSPSLPIFSVNRTVGEWLRDNRFHFDCKIKGYIDQQYIEEDHTSQNPEEWTSGVVAYDVIGNITIDKSPCDMIAIISDRYDGWWGETPGDSGAGAGIVLGIAKYFKDNNIKPKYNLTFLFTTGEEYGKRGAHYYNDTHPDDNITYFIGMDQLGFNQTGSYLNPQFYDKTIRDVVWAIANQTNYKDRTGYGFEPKLFESKEDYSSAEDDIWRTRSNCDTICILKDAKPWYNWHHSGLNFIEGDSLKNTDQNDLNVTFELAWYITKYFTVDPNCWFSNISYTAIDSPNDGDALPDSIKVNFTINSILPNDLVMINASLIDSSSEETVSNTIVNYTVTSAGLEGSISVPIPDADNAGNYSLSLELYNSTGRINEIIGTGNYNDTSNSDVFHLYHPFGYTKVGSSFKCVADNISGSVFMANEDGYAYNITAYINQAFMSPGPYKCMLYRANDSKLIGNTTENWTLRDDENPLPSSGWAVFPFSEPKPSLIQGTQYVISCWGNSSFSRLYYDDFSFQRGRYDNETYGTPPTYANFTNESRLYSIYCSYRSDITAPEITSVTSNPSVVGFGFNVSITANVTDDKSGVGMVKINITYPNHSHVNYTMTHTAGNNYQYVFNDTWEVGQYNYTIWAIDNFGNSNSSGGHHFHVSASATISISTLEDNYGSNEYINITDPPTPLENYSLVDRGLTWDEYYNAVTGQNVLEVSAGPINYQDEDNEWNPIGCTLNMLSSSHPAYQYGYRAGNDHGLYNVYFKPNAQNSWPVAFAYNKSEDPTTSIIRSKIVGVGYLDPASNWAYKYLQQVTSSQGQIDGNSATYEDVFTGTDVTWSYGNTELKEAITMGNTTKTLLQNHPPSENMV
jgi:hypothetical protein